MPVYRYKNALVNISELARKVPGSLVLGSATSTFVDIDAPTGSKADLDDVMALRGYTFHSQDPTSTPDAQTVSALGVDMRDILVYDHFTTGNLDLDEIGIMGWRTSVSGTGADLAASGEIGHPGIIDMGAGTATAGKAALYLGETSQFNFMLGTTQNELNMEWLVRLNATALLAASMDRITLGWGDAWEAANDVEHSNGAYIEFRPADSTAWRLTTASGGARTKTSSAIVAAASTWYRMGLRVTYPSGVPTVEFLINGEVRATNTATFPTTGLAVGIRIDGATSGSEARMQLDYVIVKQVTAKET